MRLYCPKNDQGSLPFILVFCVVLAFQFGLSNILLCFVFMLCQLITFHIFVLNRALFSKMFGCSEAVLVLKLYFVIHFNVFLTISTPFSLLNYLNFVFFAFSYLVFKNNT